MVTMDIGIPVVVAIVVLIFCLCSRKYRKRNDISDGKRTIDLTPPVQVAESVVDIVDGTNIPQPQQQSHPLVNGRSMNGSEFSFAGYVDPKRPLSQSSSLAHSPYIFRYEELEDVTNNFSTANLLGEGGFGEVYRGTFDGKSIAVKRLKANTNQGEREFKAEVEIISRIHHRHLVSLVGYCMAETDQRLLVYEFLPNDTLEKYLHGEDMTSLDWATSLKIATGVARGLAYLHDYCKPRIFHRDIKSSNILLDHKFEAKLSDFGLAKLIPDAFSHVTTRVMGSFGYMAPEYSSSGQLTEKSDVFSFGVVLLELITGRKSVDVFSGEKRSLAIWARPLLIRAKTEGKLDGLVDERLGNEYNVNEMMQMVEYAAACVRWTPDKRPRMVQIVRALDVHYSLIDLNEDSGHSGFIYSENNSSQNTSDFSSLRNLADLHNNFAQNANDFNSLRELAGLDNLPIKS